MCAQNYVPMWHTQVDRPGAFGVYSAVCLQILFTQNEVGTMSEKDEGKGKEHEESEEHGKGGGKGHKKPGKGHRPPRPPRPPKGGRDVG